MPGALLDMQDQAAGKPPRPSISPASPPACPDCVACRYPPTTPNRFQAFANGVPVDLRAGQVDRMLVFRLRRLQLLLLEQRAPGAQRVAAGTCPGKTARWFRSILSPARDAALATAETRNRDAKTGLAQWQQSLCCNRPQFPGPRLHRAPGYDSPERVRYAR